MFQQNTFEAERWKTQIITFIRSIRGWSQTTEGTENTEGFALDEISYQEILCLLCPLPHFYRKNQFGYLRFAPVVVEDVVPYAQSGRGDGLGDVPGCQRHPSLSPFTPLAWSSGFG
jgi:hypothetical protein